MNNEIMELRKQIAALNTRLDELERTEKQKKTKIHFDPVEIFNENDISLGDYDEQYYWMNVDYLGAQNFKAQIDNGEHDMALYNSNNYIPARYFSLAEEVLNITRLNMFLARQRLIYCPDFVPNNEDYHEIRYSIKYDQNNKCFCPLVCVIQIPVICFPSEEIAERICEKLNNYLASCCGAVC